MKSGGDVTWNSITGVLLPQIAKQIGDERPWLFKKSSDGERARVAKFD